MITVTKKELVDRIADQLGVKRVIVKRVTQQFLDEVIAELGRGNRLEFRDFGVLSASNGRRGWRRIPRRWSVCRCPRSGR